MICLVESEKKIDASSPKAEGMRNTVPIEFVPSNLFLPHNFRHEFHELTLITFA